ncbi:tail fiber domain-containing protein [Flavobacteriaceae bacterium]|nr:tail fiber domain-containing protein [Flavobacteriaceae bacterium]
MKKILTLLALTIAFTVNAQVQYVQTNNSGSTSASAIGYYTTASGSGTLATGRDTEAIGDWSTAMGYKSKANGNNSIAMGSFSEANGLTSLAMGNQVFANGDYSTAIGQFSEANGSHSTALGKSSKANDYSSLVIGYYNLSGNTVTGSATQANPANTAFVIGNGTFSNRSDAFKVMANGDTTVSNDLTVGGDIVVSSDARLKANIVSLGSTLAKLLLIDGKTYTMKKNGKQKIGVLAQDIQKVFPELVTTDDKDMLAVNYQGLVPVLINALKEQDDKISRLEKLVEKLISDN